MSKLSIRKAPRGQRGFCIARLDRGLVQLSVPPSTPLSVQRDFGLTALLSAAFLKQALTGRSR